MKTRFISRFYEADANKLYASATPSSLNTEERTKNLNFILSKEIQVIVNLMEEHEINHDFELFFDYAPEFEKSGIESVRFPIEDINIPKSYEYATEILDFIDGKINEGKKVLVHCWGGIGRTGTIVGCYLLRHQLAEPSNVIAVIDNLRKNTATNDRYSPETFLQINFVKNFLDS